MSRYNIVGKREAPPPPYTYDLVCIPLEAIPYVAGAVRLRRVKYWWQTEEDVRVADDLLSRFMEGILMPCGLDIVNAVDRVYNLLDSSLNGIERGVTGDGTTETPFVYTPPLVQVSAASTYESPGIHTTTRDIRSLALNLADGSASALTSETRNFRQQLEDIRQAIADTGANSEDTEAILNLILLALG